jgi:hypothetical protein
LRVTAARAGCRGDEVDGQDEADHGGKAVDGGAAVAPVGLAADEGGDGADDEAQLADGEFGEQRHEWFTLWRADVANE